MKKIIVLLLFVGSASLSYGQKSLDVGIMLGVSNYNGELTQSPFENFHFAGGLVGRYNLNDHFSLKGNVFYERP